MNPSDKEIIRDIYSKFYYIDTRDNKEWSVLDEQMSQLESLNQKQVVIEAKVLLFEQKKGTPRCTKDHPIDECVVPGIIKAVEAVIGEYDLNKEIIAQYEFILRFYIAVSGAGFIRS